MGVFHGADSVLLAGEQEKALAQIVVEVNEAIGQALEAK